MKHRSKNLLLCCLLLCVGTSSALFGSGSSRERRQRRRLTEAYSANVDIDAATGTVQNVVPEEEKAATTTCDGQMALSVVRANDALLAAESERDSVKEKHEKAVDRIAGLEKSVQELNEQISSLESSRKSQVEQVVQDKDTEIAELTSKLNLSRGDIQKELDTKLQQLRDQTEASLKGKDEEIHQVSSKCAREIQELQQLTKDREEQFEALLVKTKEESKNFMLSQVQATKKDVAQQEQEILEKLSTKDETIKGLTAEVQATKKEMAQQEQENLEKLSTKDETIKGLTSEIKNNMEEKIQAQNALGKAQEVRAILFVYRYLLALHAFVSHFIFFSIDDSINRFSQEVELLKENYNSRSYCDFGLIGRDLYSATAAAASACSATSARAASIVATEADRYGRILLQKLKVVGGDCYVYSARAASIAATEVDRYGRILLQKLKVVGGYLKDKSAILYKEIQVAGGDLKNKSAILYKEVQVAGGDLKNKSAALYQEQYEKHWPKVKPHYDERVAPVVAKFEAWKEKELDPKYQKAMAKYREIKENEFDPRFEVASKKFKELKKDEFEPRFEQLKQKSREQFKDRARRYAHACQEALEFGRNLANEKNLPFDDTIAPYIKESCQHPEESITNFFYAWLAIFAFFFRRRIFRLIFGIVGFFWGLFVSFTPLRFFIRRKKAAPAKTLDTDVNKGNEVRVKKKSVRISQ